MTTRKKSAKRDVVQIQNPTTGHYVKIDRANAKIVSHKKSPGPYKGVPIARIRQDYETENPQGKVMTTKKKLPKLAKPDFVQVKSPKTGHYVKIDRANAKIVSHKTSPGPYKSVPFARRRP